MSAPFITISSGRKEGQFNGPDGAYSAVLVEVADPQTAIAKKGDNAGQEYTYIEWTFAIEHDEYQGTLDYRTSDRTGPQSKIFALLTALSGGKALKPGMGITKEQLIGRSAILTVATNPDNDYPYIANISASPTASKAPIAKPAEKAEPVATAAADDSDLPF